MLLKLTGSVAMLLVESNRAKWEKHLKRENGKRVTHALANKWTHGTVKATIKAHEKLAKTLKGWDMVMNPHDPFVWNRDVD